MFIQELTCSLFTGVCVVDAEVFTGCLCGSTGLKKLAIELNPLWLTIWQIELCGFSILLQRTHHTNFWFEHSANAHSLLPRNLGALGLVYFPVLKPVYLS